MKQILLPLLLLSALGLALQLPAQSPTFHPSDLPKIAKTEGQAHLGKLHAPTLAPADDYDVRYQRMQWQVDPAVRYIRGAVTTYFETRIDDFIFVHFDLLDTLQVDSVRYHGLLLFFPTSMMY